MGKFSLKQNRPKMKGFVGVTDNDWFAFLSHQPGIDEVNFWQPGGTGQHSTEKRYWPDSTFN